jgi:RimJ/RimL family protein N-acetyltransferase
VIHLEKSKSKPDYWHIYDGKKRAGKVFIEVIDEFPFGKHCAIQIFVNKENQGEGIGSVAYKKACMQSGYGRIYAHMRKSNIASKKAAEHAGFKEIVKKGDKQLTLVWKKSSKKAL